MLALGCDHGGYELMQEVKKHLENRGIAYHDFGCSSTESVDYPIYGKKVAEAVARGEFEKGILICGTGIGISIAANKAVLEEICKAYNIKAEDLIRQFYLWVIREPEAAAQWLKGENNRKNAQRLFYSGGKEKISKN